MECWEDPLCKSFDHREEDSFELESGSVPKVRTRSILHLQQIRFVVHVWYISDTVRAFLDREPLAR